MSNNRLFKTIRNISWRAVVLFLTAIANLIIPRYIILIYGSEVNGLTTSIAHVLSIVNLIQAGLGSSVTYLMYKPLADNDRISLASIILSAKRIYRYISLGVSCIGALASVIFAYAVKTDLQRSFILIASLITCIDSASSTYFTAVGNIFLGAKQDGYLVSRISIVSNVVGYILKILVIIFKPHYMSLYAINIVVCAINIVAISKCFRRQYQPYFPTDEEKKQVHILKIPSVSYAAANEIAHSTVTGSITIIISMIAGLKAASIFSVYMIAISVLGTISNAIYSAVVPSYGSVAAEEDIAKTNRIFEIYQFVLFSLNTFMYMCAAYLMMPFVALYTTGVSDADYINETLMILILSYGIFNMTRIPYNNTVYIRGLFKETYLQPVICAVISIAFMVVFTRINYTYTILGPIFFFLSNTLYQHFKIPKLYSGFDNSHFWRHILVLLIGVAASVMAYYIHPIHPQSYLIWFVDACITGIIALLVLTVLIVVFDRKSMNLAMEYFKLRFDNRKQKGEK